MLIISQNDNSKELKLETNFNVLQYGNIPSDINYKLEYIE